MQYSSPAGRTEVGIITCLPNLVKILVFPKDSLGYVIRKCKAMSKLKKKTAGELVKTHPGAFKRRAELILALCASGVASVSHYNANSKVYGKFIVEVANEIIELTEQ